MTRRRLNIFVIIFNNITNFKTKFFVKVNGDLVVCLHMEAHLEREKKGEKKGREEMRKKEAGGGIEQKEKRREEKRMGEGKE